MPLAGEIRPLLLDDAGAVIDIFRSAADFEIELHVRAQFGNPVDVLVADPALDLFADLIRAAFRPERTLTNPVLARRHGVETMTQAAREAIAAQAKCEGMAPKTGEILFARDGGKPGRNARRRLGRWSNEAPQFRRAYDLKEEFVALCSVFKMQAWEGWRGSATALAGVDRGGLPAIDYAAVVAVFERYADGLPSLRPSAASGAPARGRSPPLAGSRRAARAALRRRGRRCCRRSARVPRRGGRRLTIDDGTDTAPWTTLVRSMHGSKGLRRTQVVLPSCHKNSGLRLAG